MAGPARHWATVPPAAGQVPAHLRARRGARSRTVRVLVGLLIVAVLAGSGLVTLLTIGADTGLVGLVTGVVLAVVPVLIVVPCLLWLDRLESEPPMLLILTFAWGALVATFIALLVNSYSLELLRNAGAGMSTAAVFVAPWVEETSKGAAVLFVLLWRRREFDGVVDGIVYAGLAGAGFAFTENILYLGRALADGGTSALAVTFVLRSFVGPFAHPMFTMATGVGLGLYVSSPRRAVRLLAPPIGWLCAVALHALWNLGAVAGLRGFVTAYVLLQVPIFVAAVSLAIWARRREARLIRDQLQVYVRTGWLTDGEVQMLASGSQRRAAKAWAGAVRGASGRRSMSMFQGTATDLAFLRARMYRGTAGANARDDERDLLQRLAVQRYGFVPNVPPIAS